MSYFRSPAALLPLLLVVVFFSGAIVDVESRSTKPAVPFSSAINGKDLQQHRSRPEHQPRIGAQRNGPIEPGRLARDIPISSGK